MPPPRRSDERPRELRRRVAIPAQLRSGNEWSDASILNISSRGMMIHAGRAGPEGSPVELRQGSHSFVARVVWREGARAGLQADERIPVEEILVLTEAGALRLVAPKTVSIKRRRRPRRQIRDARAFGRMLEFVGVGVAALCLALVIGALVEQAFARTLAQAEFALRG